MEWDSGWVGVMGGDKRKKYGELVIVSVSGGGIKVGEEDILLSGEMKEIFGKEVNGG